MQLQQFDQKRLTSVEKEFRQSPEDVERSDTKEAMDLSNWIQAQLGSKAAKVKITNRLASHPCVITGTKIKYFPGKVNICTFYFCDR